MARGGVGAPLLLLASPPLLVLVLLLSSSCALLRSARGTDGFTAVELPEALFKVQKPYDTPLDERHEFVDGMRRMWVSARHVGDADLRRGGACDDADAARLRRQPHLLPRRQDASINSEPTKNVDKLELELSSYKHI